MKAKITTLLVLLAAAFVWLCLPAATDSHRIAFACFLPFVAGWIIFKKRNSFWWPPLIIILLILSLGAIYLTASHHVDHWFVGRFVKLITAFLAATFLCWTFVRLGLPKAVARAQVNAFLFFSIAFPFFMFITAFAWWFCAVEINTYPSRPVVRNSTEFAKAYEDYILDYKGLILVGRVGDLTRQDIKIGTPQDFVAYYETSLASFGKSSPASWYPLHYTVTMLDGTEVQVEGNTSRLQTFDWPAPPAFSRYHGLKHGALVAIWADPYQTSDSQVGQKSWALQNTRIIAHGSAENFVENFLRPGVRTARVFGWVGFGCMFASVIPFVLGLRRCFWLRKHGSEGAPKLSSDSAGE